MGGETEDAPSAWTIDSAMLHFKGLAAAIDLRHQEHFEAVSARFTDHLAAHDVALSAALTATKEAVAEADRRYTQRFEAQEQAMTVAMAAAEKAVNAALTAAKEAVTKAEVAQEKRMDSVNEFRSQLTDILNRTMPRLEAEQRIAQNTEKVDSLETRLNESLSRVHSRLDLAEGRSGGSREQVAERRQSNAAVYAAIGVAIAVLSLLMAFGGYLAARS